MLMRSLQNFSSSTAIKVQKTVENRIPNCDDTTESNFFWEPSHLKEAFDVSSRWSSA